MSFASKQEVAFLIFSHVTDKASTLVEPYSKRVK